MLIDWSNGVLCSFQQHFEYLVATACIIHVLGLWSVLPMDTPQENPKDPVWLTLRIPGLQVKHFSTEPYRITASCLEWMNERRFTARRHQRPYWAHSQVTIINHTASCLDSNEIDQYQKILKQCKRAQIVYTDMVNTVSRCTYIPFYRTWLIIIVQQYYCMDRSSILKCFEGKEYFVPFFPFFHLYFWLCRWQLGGCTVSKDWSQRWVDLLCSFLNLWFELKFSYLLCTSNNA